MGRLIDAEPFDFNKVIIPDGGANFMRGYGLGAKHVCDEIDAAPTIDAVPIKAISAWLAGYAAPPLYASDHVAALKNKVSIKTETERAEAWEYHWKHMMECGLLQEEQDGTNNP